MGALSTLKAWFLVQHMLESDSDHFNPTGAYLSRKLSNTIAVTCNLKKDNVYLKVMRKY